MCRNGSVKQAVFEAGGVLKRALHHSCSRKKYSFKSTIFSTVERLAHNLIHRKCAKLQASGSVAAQLLLSCCSVVAQWLLMARRLGLHHGTVPRYKALIAARLQAGLPRGLLHAYNHGNRCAVPPPSAAISILTGVCFVCHFSSCRLAYLAIADCVHRCDGADPRAFAVPAARQDLAAHIVR